MKTEKFFATKAVPVKSKLQLAEENLSRVLNELLTPEEIEMLADALRVRLFHADGSLRW